MIKSENCEDQCSLLLKPILKEVDVYYYFKAIQTVNVDLLPNQDLH
jgi:hypothetical protein